MAGGWGSYITFLFPLPTAAVAFQATKLSFSLSRWFQRLRVGVALCSRGRDANSGEEGRAAVLRVNSLLAAGHGAVQVSLELQE